MRNLFSLFLVTVLISLSCTNQSSKYSKAENAFDAGREFIDGSLKGDFQKSATYMLPDSINIQLLNQMEKEYRLKDKEGRQQYRTASIQIQQVDDIDSSNSVIKFSNSYDKKNQQVKVVKQHNSWLVDLKYSFQNK